MDDDFLKIFPDKSGDKGHTYPLHELWPQDFTFDPTDKRGSRQYDDAVLARVRPKFEETVRAARPANRHLRLRYCRQPDAEKALAAAEKAAKAVASQLTKKVRDGGLLDREFDQFGQNALKTVLKEVSAKVKEWAAAVAIPEQKPKTAPRRARRGPNRAKLSHR